MKRKGDLICSNCKKEFYTKNPKKRKYNFCSKECHIDFHTGVFKCKNCGKEEKRPKWKIKAFKYCSIECKAEATKRENSHLWKGGRTITSDGYIAININGKWIREHRYLIEQKIGRKLRKDEIVHHKNFKKRDNRLRNLELMTRTEHNKIHHPKENNYRCKNCGKVVSRKETRLCQRCYIGKLKLEALNK